MRCPHCESNARVLETRFSRLLCAKVRRYKCSNDACEFRFSAAVNEGGECELIDASFKHRMAKIKSDHMRDVMKVRKQKAQDKGLRLRDDSGRVLSIRTDDELVKMDAKEWMAKVVWKRPGDWDGNVPSCRTIFDYAAN